MYEKKMLVIKIGNEYLTSVTNNRVNTTVDLTNSLFFKNSNELRMFASLNLKNIDYSIVDAKSILK